MVGIGIGILILLLLLGVVDVPYMYSTFNSREVEFGVGDSMFTRGLYEEGGEIQYTPSPIFCCE